MTPSIPIFRNEINALEDFWGGWVKVARDFAVGRQPVLLEVVAQEHSHGDIVADEPPAGKDRGRKLFAADIGVAERARDIVIDAAAEHEFEHRPIPIEARRHPQEAAVREAALAPDIGGGEEK